MSLVQWFRKRRKSDYTYYTKQLQRYRQEHPESLEQEREKIHEWLAYVQSRKCVEQNNQEERYHEDVRLASALYELREAARTAFMSHPAATEYDFHRCWPHIREEILKQHALEELAANPELLSRVAGSAGETRRANSAPPLYPRLTDTR